MISTQGGKILKLRIITTNSNHTFRLSLKRKKGKKKNVGKERKRNNIRSVEED